MKQAKEFFHVLVFLLHKSDPFLQGFSVLFQIFQHGLREDFGTFVFDVGPFDSLQKNPNEIAKNSIKNPLK